MTSTTSSVSLDTPVDQVWELLADFADISLWAGNVSQSSLLTEGPPGIGTVRRVQVGRSALRETVTTWGPGRSLAYEIAGLPAIVTSAGNTWTLEPHGTGTTATLTGEVTTRVGGLVDRLVARKVGQANEQLVASLAAALRSRS